MTRAVEAKLFCPHSKEYCVSFQSRFATLKGIENNWSEVSHEQSCEWENQQHGRNHHIKIRIRNATEGTVFALRLCQEDGTAAPDFARVKNGNKKSTMLIGLDAREGSLGLTWTTLACEGPRQWVPASTCAIAVSSTATRNARETPEQDKVVLTVPPGKDIIIPVRIEVLSAAKGAGDFTRYSVNCFQIQHPIRRNIVKSGWNWNSPPILIEAKWLPAAPVRMNNKQRLEQYRRVSSTGSGSTTTSTKDKSDEVGKEPVFGPSSNVSTPGGPSTLDHLLATFRLLTAFLTDPSTFAQDPSMLSNLDMPVQELQCALSQYLIKRAQTQQRLQMDSRAPNAFFYANQLSSSTNNYTTGPQYHQHHHAHATLRCNSNTTPNDITSSVNKKRSAPPARKKAPVETKSPSLSEEDKQQQGSGVDATKKKQKTTHELLSSPPRGPKFAPISSEMMAAITLPGSAFSASNGPSSMALGNTSALHVHHQAKSPIAPQYPPPPDASFAEFDLLATAASAQKLQ